MAGLNLLVVVPHAEDFDAVLGGIPLRAMQRKKRQECRSSLFEASLVFAVQLLVEGLQFGEIHGAERFLPALG